MSFWNTSGVSAVSCTFSIHSPFRRSLSSLLLIYTNNIKITR
nr:MAG TPA: hypothetical protein [Caudoviricetes sp.]